MHNLSIYIIEDEALYADQLQIYIEQLEYECAGLSDNSDTALVEIAKLKPDLLLVDININGTMDGIELMHEVQKRQEIPIIFISSYTDSSTFSRAKTVNPYAYLTKPFDAAQLQRTIELAFNSSEETPSSNKEDVWKSDISYSDAFFIKGRNKLQKVNIADILYLEVEDRYSTIVTDQGKKFVLRMSMGQVLEKLPTSDFIRIHRKYTANIQKIDSVDLQQNMLQLNNFSLPISKNGKELLLQQLAWLQ